MDNGKTELADLELVRRVAEGDDSAYAAIVRRYQGTIRATASRFLDSIDDVDDLAQDCFVQAYQKLNAYRGKGSLEGWLRRIAVRLCYDRLRANARSRLLTSGIDEEELSRLDAGVADADNQAEEVAMRDLAQRFLARLRPADRMVLVLQVVEGYSVKEIATMTGWSPALVRVRANRARNRAARLVQELEAQALLGREPR